MTPLDIIGTLYQAQTDPDVPPEPLTGWHVNTTTDGLAERPDLAHYVVTPSALRRVWAGDNHLAPTWTVALRFADEAEALAAL